MQAQAYYHLCMSPQKDDNEYAVTMGMRATYTGDELEWITFEDGSNFWSDPDSGIAYAKFSDDLLVVLD
jgi:hypothetical protein